VPLPTYVSRSISPTPVDLLAPRKRFRDSYSPEDSGEEHIEGDTADAKAVADVGISEGVIARPKDGVHMGFEIAASDVREDDEEFEEEFHQVHKDRDDTPRRLRRLELYVERHLEALAAYEVTRATNALEAKNQSQNDSDGDNGNGGNGDGENENGENGNGGNGNPNENGRGDRHDVRECTYQDFMKCQPLNFKGMEGVVGLIRWFEKMETTFYISNCPEKSQVKYATCILLNSALTWWNSHKRTIGTEAAFVMS
ncbi:hypothetical protein Tco_0615709, partial [Tanacetum coccineum]